MRSWTGIAFFTGKAKSAFGSGLEQLNIENVQLLCKDLSSNPCREIGVGGLCPPLSDNLKAKLL